MKIATINTVADWHNAPGRIMNQISEAALSRGDDVLVAYGRGATPTHSNVYRIGSCVDVLGHALLSRITDSSGFHSNRATQKLIRVLENYSPDLVHLHNLHGYYLNVSLLMSWLKKSGIPIVWTLHDCWPMTGHCAYYAYNKCLKSVDGCKKCEFNHVYPKSFVSRSAHNFVMKQKAFTGFKNMRIVAVSQWLAKEVKRSFLAEYKVDVIGNGVDVDIFYPQENKFKRLIILGVASKWIQSKNLECFESLARIYPDAIIRIVGNVSFRQKYKAPSNMEFVGEIRDAHELARLYNNSSVFVNASREETFGMTTIEAMACGVPVVVNNTTALPEILGNGGGRAVDIDDIDALTAAIQDVIKFGEEIGGMGRNWALNCFSKEKMVQSYLALYDDCLGIL